MKKVFLLFLIVFLPAQSQAQQSLIQYLSGTGADNTTTWEFYCTAGANSKTWKTIQVPSCWEQQGYGSYNYGHDKFEDRINEEGLYRFSFEGNENWKNKQIDLVFEGVMTDCEVKLNGKIIGTHQGAFYEFSFDVTNALKLGQSNLLEVKVKKHSDNESVNQAERNADYWIFGGIFRPVYLRVNPKEYIDRVAIDARANGDYKADVFLKGVKNASSVEVSIVDFKNNIQTVFEQKNIKNSDSIRVNGVFSNPKVWSPEHPNRYIASFKLLNSEKKVLHQYSQKIGFRTVEVREADGIYVNGVKTKFKGVNSHTFHPDFGRTSSEKLSLETVNIIKDMNMNAIRFSHYPHDKHLLNVCDSLGLYVLNELGGWQAPSYDTKIGKKLLREMIKRDVNNPSVILWDNANEGGWNTAYDQDFANVDIQKREVLHPWGAFEKTVTSHYIDYDYLAFDHFAARQIFFPTEFLHGLYDGGHGAGLDDYWQKMWNHPLSAGGFLWVLADESIKRTDTGLLDSDGNHAPDGIVGPYLEKEGSFYTIKKIWSPIQLEEKYITPQFEGKLNIENRFQFTSLGECKLEYRWVNYSENGEKIIVSKGTPLISDLKPMESGVLQVPLVEGWKNTHALELIATDPFGRNIYNWTYAVTTPKKEATVLNRFSIDKKINFSESDSDYIFTTSNGIKIAIGKKDGLLKSVTRKDGIIPFTNGPVIIENTMTVAGVKHETEGLSHSIRVSFEKDRQAFKWTIEPSGLLKLDLEYEPKGKTYTAGIDFDLLESEMVKVKMMANGPYRVWKNRLKGAEFGVWEKTFNNTITGHSGFEYPEFKGYYSNLHWVEFSLKEGKTFKIYSQSDDLFLKLYNPQEAPDPAKSTVSHSAGAISFMNGIPAIGTKFKKADALGPQSLPYTFASKRVLGGKLSIKLIFDFTINKK